MDLLAQAVLKLKTEPAAPNIIIAGDFNQADIDTAIGDFEDIETVTAGPTRGSSYLDKAAINFGHELHKVENSAPLETEDGKKFNHRFAVYNFNLQHLPFQLDPLHRAIRNGSGCAEEAGVRRQAEEIKKLDWTKILTNDMDVDQRAERIHGKLMQIKNECFPEVKKKIKSMDDPG